MADEDEVDILGDFSLDSCFPGVSNNKECNIQSDLSSQSGICSGHNRERIKTIQLQLGSGKMDLEQGIHLSFTAGLTEGFVQACSESTPTHIHEEILIDSSMPDSIQGVMSLVHTGQPTVSTIVYGPKETTRKIFKNKTNESKISLLKPEVLSDIGRTKNNAVEFSEIGDEILYCEDDFLIGSTESVGGTDDSLDEVNPQTDPCIIKRKAGKKSGNHRRKYTSSPSRTASKSGRLQSKFNISMSMKKKPNKLKDGAKAKAGRSKAGGNEIALNSSPKLQLVFSSGQALPVSEGEQVIKLEKINGANSEDSDVDIDIDSGEESETKLVIAPTKEAIKRNATFEFKTSFVERKFEPMRPRQKKVNRDGDGGCTIMHTDSGDLIEVVPEPRRERVPRKPPVQLFHCKPFSVDKPAPFSVRMLVSALVLMETHAHGGRAEVMGLLGGALRAGVLHVRHYAPAAAAADDTHCEMCPVSQAQAAETLNSSGHAVVGWHHSHPRFVAQPSELDLRTQRSMQEALERQHAPFVALITSQDWARGRAASHYRCLRVELEGPEQREVGYQFSVKLIPDLTAASVPDFLLRLRDVARAQHDSRYKVDWTEDVCPDAGVSYLEKCVSSVSHHLIVAGYSEQDLTFKQVIKGIRDIFR